MTEGDKVAAQIKFGFAVNGYGVGDLVKKVNEALRSRRGRAVSRTTRRRIRCRRDLKTGGARHDSIREAARIELGLRAFLTEGGISRASPPRLRICTASSSCPASRRND